MKPYAPCDHRPPAQYETLDDLYAQAAHYAEFSLREKGNMWPALFILSLDEDPAFFAWTHNFDGEADKNKFRDLCRIFCMAHGATHSVLALETWTVALAFQPGEPAEYDGPLPSESPDRVEVITMLGEHQGYETQMRLLPIIRSDNQKFFGLGEINALPGYMAAGRFTPLLVPGIVSAGLRKLAAASLAMEN